MKLYEFRFANVSTGSKKPADLRPPTQDPGWTVHSWQVLKTDVTPFKPSGPGMHSPAAPGSTGASLLVLWEREVANAQSDQAAAHDSADTKVDPAEKQYTDSVATRAVAQVYEQTVVPVMEDGKPSGKVVLRPKDGSGPTETS